MLFYDAYTDDMDNVIEENKIYSLEEAAKLLGITERTLAEYCRLGTITARKVGEWLILGQAIKDFLLQPPVNRLKDALQKDGLTMKDGSPAIHNVSTDVGDIFEQGLKSTNTKGEFMDLTFKDGTPATEEDEN